MSCHSCLSGCVPAQLLAMWNSPLLPSIHSQMLGLGVQGSQALSQPSCLLLSYEVAKRGQRCYFSLNLCSWGSSSRWLWLEGLGGCAGGPYKFISARPVFSWSGKAKWERLLKQVRSRSSVRATTNPLHQRLSKGIASEQGYCFWTKVLLLNKGTASEQGYCFWLPSASCLTIAEMGLAAPILDISSFHYRMTLSEG